MQELASLSFLAIDNDPQTRHIFEILLRRVIKSNNVMIFEDSAQLNEQLDQLSFVPDIVMLDVMIRPSDGYTVLQNLQENGLFQGSKFIAITAKVMQNDIRKMQQAGFHGLISKPIIRQVFPELVQRIFAGESVWYIA